MDAVIVETAHVASVQALSKTPVLAAEDQPYVLLDSKADEEEAVRLLAQGRNVILKEGWEIIPVENILAQTENLAVKRPAWTGPD